MPSPGKHYFIAEGLRSKDSERALSESARQMLRMSI